jgi:hypothetical protein
MENLGIFHDRLVYFTAIGNILWPFGIFCGHPVYFSPFWYFVLRKIWQPWSSGFLAEPIAFNFQPVLRKALSLVWLKKLYLYVHVERYSFETPTVNLITFC